MIDTASIYRRLWRVGKRLKTPIPLAVILANASWLQQPQFFSTSPSTGAPCRIENSFIVPMSTLYTQPYSLYRLFHYRLCARNRNRGYRRARVRGGIDTDQFMKSEMPSKRPLSNKVGVPDAEVMQPHPHLPANHLSPRRGEFEGGCGELLS